jgi:hypothetical protein
MEVLHFGKLLAQPRFEHGTAGFHLFAQLLGRGRIEGRAVRGDLVADGGDAVFEIERRAAIAVRLQELPKPLADRHIAHTAGLDFGSPLGPFIDLGADLWHAEPEAPGFEAVLPVHLAEGCILRPRRDFSVDVRKMRQDQSRGDQRVYDSTFGRRRPSAAQYRRVVTLMLWPMGHGARGASASVTGRGHIRARGRYRSPMTLQWTRVTA